MANKKSAKNRRAKTDRKTRVNRKKSLGGNGPSDTQQPLRIKPSMSYVLEVGLPKNRNSIILPEHNSVYGVSPISKIYYYPQEHVNLLKKYKNGPKHTDYKNNIKELLLYDKLYNHYIVNGNRENYQGKSILTKHNFIT